MSTILWAMQFLLAALFFYHGLALAGVIAKPKKLEESAIIRAFPVSFIRIVGWAEFLGALGLLLPGLTGILPILTALAAAGLSLIMTGAVIEHFKRRELPEALVNIAIITLCEIVAFSRWLLVPL